MSTPSHFKTSGEHAHDAARLARERKEAEDEARRLEAQLDTARHAAEQKRQEELQSQDAAKKAFQAEHGERQAAFRLFITQGHIGDLKTAIGVDPETVEKIEAVAAGDADTQVLDSFADAVLETLSGDRNQFLQGLACKMVEGVATSGLFPLIADEVVTEREDDVAPSTEDDPQGSIMDEQATLSVEVASDVLHKLDGDDQDPARSSPAPTSPTSKQPLDSLGEYALAPHPTNTVWNAVDRITEAETANAHAASLVSESTQSIEAHAADDDNSEITPSTPAISTLPAQLDTKRKRQGTDALAEGSRTSTRPHLKQARRAKDRYRLIGRAKDFVKALKDLDPEDEETRFRCAVCFGVPLKPRVSKCLHLYCDACWDDRLQKGGKKGIKTPCALDGCTGEMGKKAKMQKTEHPSLAPLHKMEKAPEVDGEEDADGSGDQDMAWGEENATQPESMEA